MIICNATPLIAFARIQRLDILHQVIGEIEKGSSLCLTLNEKRTGKAGIIIYFQIRNYSE